MVWLFFCCNYEGTTISSPWRKKPNWWLWTRYCRSWDASHFISSSLLISQCSEVTSWWLDSAEMCWTRRGYVCTVNVSNMSMCSKPQLLTISYHQFYNFLTKFGVSKMCRRIRSEFSGQCSPMSSASLSLVSPLWRASHQQQRSLHDWYKFTTHGTLCYFSTWRYSNISL